MRTFLKLGSHKLHLCSPFEQEHTTPFIKEIQNISLGVKILVEITTWRTQLSLGFR